MTSAMNVSVELQSSTTTLPICPNWDRADRCQMHAHAHCFFQDGAGAGLIFSFGMTELPCANCAHDVLRAASKVRFRSPGDAPAIQTTRRSAFINAHCFSYSMM
jgi:hypothetical protein